MATGKKAKSAATVAKTPKRANASTRTTLKIKATGTTPAATSTTTPLPYWVVYIHGIGKQEAPAALKANWDMALFGQTMTGTAMAYWADIRHPQKTGAVGVQSLARSDKALASDQAQQFMAALQDKVRPRADVVHPSGEYRGEVFGLFPGIGDALFKWLSKDFIKDTAAYFFDPVQKKAMQQRLIDVLDQCADKPVVLVAHSQGTIIAYDVLRKLNGRAPSGQKLQIPLFVTMGSPLGIDEVQRKLTQPLQVPGGVAAWANFADLLDPVALDKRLAGEFRGEVGIHDTLVHNPVFGNPHSAVGYLSTAPVRSSVYGVLGWNQMRFGARVRKDVLADLVQSIGAHELDDSPVAPERHCVLFELRDVAAFGESARDGMHTNAKLKSLDQHRDMVVAWLEHNVQDREAAR
ncbi:MAG TPA: hypothetical protein VFN13_05695, partial [Rudaea sp.]|nr:hypothetical protein [Rudaea sp.]